MGSNAFELNPGVMKEGGASIHHKLLEDSMPNPNSAKDTADKGEARQSDEKIGEKLQSGSASQGRTHESMQDGLNDLDKSDRLGELAEQMGRKGEIDNDPHKLEHSKPDEGNIIERVEKAERNGSLEDVFKKLEPKAVTPEQRMDAKRDIQDRIPAEVSPGDRKALVSMQEAIIDGNVEKLGQSIESLRGDPERMERLINGLNRQLKESDSDTRVTMTKDGRVFLSNPSSDTAVQFNKDGTSEVKPVEHTFSGAIVVKPGEVINRSAEDVASSIGDRTTRDINRPNFKPIEKPDYRKPIPFDKPWDDIKPLYPERGGPKQPFNPKDWIEEMGQGGIRLLNKEDDK
ncbi:MAG: hypothetical protein KC652_22745 [Cyanobacteria bacterium HKST-UBA01]|nr:hypothetical protein [Cyanobacteria bacterium HKST-UBA01]